MIFVPKSNKRTYITRRVTRCRSWLRHCATSWKFAGSIGIFHWLNPSVRIMDLGSAYSASDRNEYQGKDGRCAGLTNLPPSCAESGNLNLLEPSGPVQACTGIDLPYITRNISELTTWYSTWLMSVVIMTLCERVPDAAFVWWRRENSLSLPGNELDQPDRSCSL
jgi:hypothetical protein